MLIRVPYSINVLNDFGDKHGYEKKDRTRPMGKVGIG